MLKLLKQAGLSCSCVMTVWRKWGRGQGARMGHIRYALCGKDVDLYRRYWDGQLLS